MKIADHSTFAAGDTGKSTGPTAVSRGQNSEEGQGSTTIADVVVQKIAGIATREVPGVYQLGGGASRAYGAMKGRIPGASASAGQGVSVEVGQKQAAVDLQILVEYGASIPDLSRAVRNNVVDTVEQMTGLEVVEVNINVNDVHIPGDDSDSGDKGRTDRVE
ncbi:Asp23/Gls24 family envelope stress response protein [Streptomyces sp. AM8-1-1]|uniref:Asp23/Gls24 family envelope stress response protein n=1 Tax=Streptomyces sp. AM8-1-1 TaxID=3075825 RepID=UPI0028C4BD2B|nr:Asp23/Gls24 family envelope stress response protein [Streptomyces sp. AM8-1-1]WNO76252.1 Asp23/Gls24 family envelope stress response protein [Streptomyces sp. AM8-1-1]